MVPVEEAKISIKTNSFHYGTAIFESIRAYWNEKEDGLASFMLPYIDYIQGQRWIQLEKLRKNLKHKS